MKLYYELESGRVQEFKQKHLEELRSVVQDWSDRLVMWENGELEDSDIDIQELIYTLKDLLMIGGRYERLDWNQKVNQTYMDFYNLFRRR